jgi:Co/Zn/Cd efflux system component
MSLGSHHAGHGHGQLALIDALTGEHGSMAANRLVRRSVNVSMGVNVTLSIAQIAVGWLANSHSLLVDGFHSFSDLLSDVLVLFVARHSIKAADENHPYGHARLETLATLALGTVTWRNSVRRWLSVAKSCTNFQASGSISRKRSSTTTHRKLSRTVGMTYGE